VFLAGKARAFATNEFICRLYLKAVVFDAAEYTQVRDRFSLFHRANQPTILIRLILRVQGFRFAKQLLRQQGLAV